MMALDEGASSVRLTRAVLTRLLAPDFMWRVRGRINVDGRGHFVIEDTRGRIWLAVPHRVCVAPDGTVPAFKPLKQGEMNRKHYRYGEIYLPVSGPWTAADLSAPAVVEDIADLLENDW